MYILTCTVNILTSVGMASHATDCTHTSVEDNFHKIREHSMSSAGLLTIVVIFNSEDYGVVRAGMSFYKISVVAKLRKSMKSIR